MTVTSFPISEALAQAVQKQEGDAFCVAHDTVLGFWQVVFNTDTLSKLGDWRVDAGNETLRICNIDGIVIAVVCYSNEYQNVRDAYILKDGEWKTV